MPDKTDILPSAVIPSAPIQMEVDDRFDLDPGHLMISCLEPIDNKSWNEDEIKDLATKGFLSLYAKISSLPRIEQDGEHVAELPDPVYELPREKPIPKQRPQTKWEKYAQEKGIKARKKDRKVWDEEAKEWRPMWGYKRANDKDQDWCIEVPEGADPYADYFEKRDNEKKEKVAKNELQRLRNIQKAQKLKLPNPGIVTQDKPDKMAISKQFVHAAKSTASMGVFDPEISNNKIKKTVGSQDLIPKINSRKRKFESNTIPASEEKAKQLHILKVLGSDNPVLNVEKATNKQIHQENKARAEANKSKGGTQKRNDGLTVKHRRANYFSSRAVFEKKQNKGKSRLEKSNKSKLSKNKKRSASKQ